MDIVSSLIQFSIFVTTSLLLLIAVYWAIAKYGEVQDKKHDDDLRRRIQGFNSDLSRRIQWTPVTVPVRVRTTR